MLDPLAVWALSIAGLCGLLVVVQTLVMRPKFKESRPLKIVALIISSAVLIAMVLLAVAWLAASG